MIRTGLDVLLAAPQRLTGRRYGLLAHAASVDSARLEPIHLALRRAGVDDPAALYGPEHGFHGVEQDMVGLANDVDPWTGAPVVSLYGDNEDSLRPAAAAFAGLELLLIDLQDVGSRYYTYAATAVWAAEAALAAGCEVWVLDRPNPLGGAVIEGNRRRPGFESFIGAFEIPVRHGLTLGELVLLEARRAGWSRELRVVRMEGWARELTWADCGRAWIPPSPNLPTLSATWLYPGGCLLEATDLSEGRGTTTPFELVGSPEVEPVELAKALDARGLAGVRFIPAYFRPQFQKHAGRLCGGVRCVVTDGPAMSPYRLGVELVATLHSVLGDAFGWRTEAYEFVDDRPAIDLLSGDDRLRLALAGEADLDEWLESWTADEGEFRRERRDILLYPEAAA